MIMPYDLRVKAAVGPTRAEVYATSSDAAEEWVESSDDTSNNTSRQASMSKQRRASRSSSSAVSLQGDSEGSESVVAVPPPLQRTQFSSLGELQEYLVDYEKATYQLSSLVPDEWGKRKRQQSRLLGCEAQINACVQVVDDSVPTFAVRITTVRLEHNHHLMDELRRAGAKKKSIMRYIQEKSGCVPNNQDVHNLVRKLKKQSDTAPTSAKRLRQWMIEFSAEPGNIGRIFVDKVQKKTVATCITLQTEHMRELFDRFPEVLMIDATHACGIAERAPANAYDSAGLVQAKQSCLDSYQFHVIKYLREEITRADYGFNAWQKQQLQSIASLLVYAKTLREFERYRDYMRHVMAVGSGRPFRTALPLLSSASSVPLGATTCDLGVRSDIVGAVRDELVAGHGELGARCPKLGAGGPELGTERAELRFDSSTVSGDAVGSGSASEHPFEAYFVKNWDSCRPMWCAFERQNAVTLGNNTNNRIEASWKQLKDLVNSFTVSGKLDMILIQHNSDNEDALDEPRAEYSVNKRDWVCSCLFMSSRLLPCRHVFYLRKALNYENVIPTQLLNPRWLISTLRSKNDVVEFSGESFAMAPVMQEPNVVWDSNRKFREASAVTKTINEHLSGLGMREYKTAIRALHNIATLFKHGQFDVILDASEQRLECHGGELFGDTEFADALSENDSNSVVNEASAGVLEGADISHSVQPT
ncbi:hypothetical protein PF001_g24811 [Phytophthora fragariae]|uniref:SWIM-type domain-containing protein n=2 Tax=Phytophthora fragariae TaxID=53985 RepID=A0A6A4BT11_9STRA|nr:hypothetical protein PF001_g24811 [Phytophthora fragariae]